VIVLVDDDLTVLETTRMLLQLDGHTVLTALGGEAALSLLHDRRARNEPVDLVATDQRMRTMTGLQLVEAMRRLGIATPCLLLTAWAAQISRAELDRAGCQEMLAKPVRLADLRDALARLLPPMD
jgi:CheY-like chemotaxis protein